MEFWGVEVKSGEPLKVQPEFGKLIHLSQAALGEVKDLKGAKHVPIRLTVDSNKYILGTLSAEDRPQIMFDLVFEREFELSHDLKNGSIHFIGYVADNVESDGEECPSDFSDDSSEDDEPLAIPQNGDVKPKVEDAKPAIISSKAVVKNVQEQDDDESDSDDDIDFDGEEGFSDVSGEEDSDEEDEDDEDDEEDSSEEELPPKKVQNSKKRPAESAEKTPASNKKAKQATPDKSSGGKKGHVATPFPSKAAGKSANAASKSFSKKESAPQSHKKSKHSGK